MGDLEGKAIEQATTLLSTVKYLREKKYMVTAAPEASMQPLKAYKPILPHVSWVHPQFYNNPPNGVAPPIYPPFTKGATWCTPPQKWEDPGNTDPRCDVPDGQAWWVAIAKIIGGEPAQTGMLFPTTKKAASNHNNWDIEKLKDQVKAWGIKHVGTWAIAYDNEIGYKFGKAMGLLMGGDKCAAQKLSTAKSSSHGVRDELCSRVGNFVKGPACVSLCYGPRRGPCRDHLDGPCSA